MRYSSVNPEEVLLVIKTGSTEIQKKMPVHLETSLTATPLALIFSDAAQDFHGHPIRDALSEISPETWMSSPEDHGTYQQIRQAVYRNDTDTLASIDGTKAWNLDKWKFVPMLHQAVDFMLTSTSTRWLVIIEADTTLSWPNLLRWLRHQKSNKPLLLGHTILHAGTPFAHGGSGIIISRQAAEQLRQTRGEKYKDEHDYFSAWERRTGQTRYGDLTMSLALQEAGVPVTQSWPMTQGESVASMDWLDRMWCEMHVFWHHIGSNEMRTLWDFELQWMKSHKTPTRFRDMFIHLVQPRIQSERTKWKNFSNGRILKAPFPKGAADYEKLSVVSPDACANACVHEKSFMCMQWMFTTGKCFLDKSVRLGRPTKPNAKKLWHSGWMNDRINSSIMAKGDCAGWR